MKLTISEDEYDHSGQCGICDADNIEELNFIDPSDDWGFCDRCWEIIQKTGRVD